MQLFSDKSISIYASRSIFSWTKKMKTFSNYVMIFRVSAEIFVGFSEQKDSNNKPID